MTHECISGATVLSCGEDVKLGQAGAKARAEVLPKALEFNRNSHDLACADVSCNWFFILRIGSFRPRLDCLEFQGNSKGNCFLCFTDIINCLERRDGSRHSSRKDLLS